MRIAYVGPDWGTSLQRARALERLGYTVCIVDPYRWLGGSKWVARWIHHAGAAGVGLLIDGRLEAEVRAISPAMIFIDQGEFLGPGLIRRLRKLRVPIVNYTIDDPFGGRDGARFRSYLRAVPYYDLLALVREPNLHEARVRGARHVLRVWRSADEVAHAPRELTEELRSRYGNEVVFVGTWMPERGPFIAELIRRGVPVSIWGDRWQKAEEWHAIGPHWRGPGLFDDEAYAAAIQASKVCLGLLSKGNRDLHTTRSLEIPALGGLLCAERTHEHQALYEEGREAMFWSDAAECAEICHELLSDESRRIEIARRGQERALENKLYNEPVLASVLAEAQRVFLEEA